MIVEWMKLRAPELRALAERQATVIVPLGSVEQHGPHLPVQVDARLATEIARRAARRLAEAGPRPAVVAPTVWMGLAEHHMELGATFTLDLAAYHALLECLCRSIDRHRFPRILLLNGHGGNVAALSVIAGELDRALEARVATATYWHLARAAARFAEILEDQDNVAHAGEAETSMMLALVPDLIDEAAMRETGGPLDGIVHPSGAYAYRSFSALTPTGVLGHPTRASAEKGERLLDAAAEAVAEAAADEGLWG